MTAIEGVEELVDTPEMFDVRRAGLLADIFSRGVHNFYGCMTMTVFGVAMLASASPAAAPAPHRTEPSFVEPPSILDGAEQWKSSVAGLTALIAEMGASARPAFSIELKAYAAATLTSVKGRAHEKLEPWAKSLASEAADLDD